MLFVFRFTCRAFSFHFYGTGECQLHDESLAVDNAESQQAASWVAASVREMGALAIFCRTNSSFVRNVLFQENSALSFFMISCLAVNDCNDELTQVRSESGATETGRITIINRYGVADVFQVICDSRFVCLSCGHFQEKNTS